MLKPPIAIRIGGVYAQDLGPGASLGKISACPRSFTCLIQKQGRVKWLYGRRSVYKLVATASVR